MKTFIEGLFISSFNSFKENMQKDIHERFDNVANEVAQLREQVTQIKNLSETVGKGNASEILCPSAILGKDQGQSSHSPSPPASKGNGKAAASVDPTPVRRSPRPDVQNDENDMLDFLKNLSKTSRYVDKGTQESLQEAMGSLSQTSHVKGFDPSQQLNGEEQAEWVTPLSSFKPADWRPPTLKDVESHDDRMHDPDYSLVELKIGPSMLTSELASRVMGPTQWLKNHEIDVMMWLFTERTSLRRWFPNKVAFMTCLFSNQIKNSFQEFKKDKKKFKVTGLLHQITNRNNNGAIPSRCWFGKGIVTYVSKTEENPYRRFFICEIGLQRKKENHLFKWVNEALLDEIERMAEHQVRVDEEIEDLKFL
ncbi:hypothetical protein Bca52824_024162 [Brassica carinata]|uniref:GRF-type domain-containing protein n=1 Tax=Brassica carinata TaxID=52824 RepID=A0A8X7VJP3_BRACI|nr:hypothetical protein Bca52824_024162 [Brassica carinata]